MLTKNAVSTAFQDEHNSTQREHLLACSSVFEAPMDGLYLFELEQLEAPSSGSLISSVWVVDEESETPYFDSTSRGFSLAVPQISTQTMRLAQGQNVYLQAFSANGSGSVGLSGARLSDEVPPAE